MFGSFLGQSVTKKSRADVSEKWSRWKKWSVRECWLKEPMWWIPIIAHPDGFFVSRLAAVFDKKMAAWPPMLPFFPAIWDESFATSHPGVNVKNSRRSPVGNCSHPKVKYQPIATVELLDLWRSWFDTSATSFPPRPSCLYFSLKIFPKLH